MIGFVAVPTAAGRVLVAGGLLGDPIDVGSGASTADYRYRAFDSAELFTP